MLGNSEIHKKVFLCFPFVPLCLIILGSGLSGLQLRLHVTAGRLRAFRLAR